MGQRTALVSVKFDKDPWNDKRFRVIADVLERPAPPAQTSRR